MKRLRGITWDHPRGIDPLRAASDQYALEHGISVSWVARPLASFEDTPADELAREYDLLAIDHPSIGDAMVAGALLPLDDLVGAEAIEERLADSAGPSQLSYLWDDRYWALGIDAACMTSALRADRVDMATLPSSWYEVADFARELGTARVLMPANSTHLYCTFVTLCEAVSTSRELGDDGSPWWWTSRGIEPTVALKAIELLREVVGACHRDSLTSNPIEVLDRLVSDDAVSYVPLSFQYVTYSLERRGLARATFVDVPGGRGTLTGGVGLAVSAFSGDAAAAASFALYASSRETQMGVFARSGGQPARRSAWLSRPVNRTTLDFFDGTLATMSAAFVRPRTVGYPQFQVAAGAMLHEKFAGGASAQIIGNELDRLWSTIIAR